MEVVHRDLQETMEQMDKTEHKVQSDQQVLKVFQEMMGQRVLRALLDQMECLDRKDLQAMMDQMDRMVRMVLMELKDLLD